MGFRSILIPMLLLWPASGQWNLPQVVRAAGERYPATAVSLSKVSEAAAEVQLARTAYLPRADYIAQVNRATRNNVFGMLLPQSVIAPISGPPLATNAGTNVWGSATGFLVTWEAFDLGQRKAKEAVAAAEQARTERAHAVSKFQAESAAADVFFTILAADELIKSGEAGVKRAGDLVRTVEALAGAGLKPGADLSKARLELAAADGQLIQARTAARTARGAMAEFLGEEAESMAVDGSAFSAAPWQVQPAQGMHPLVAEQQASMEVSKARTHELSKAWAPRFLAQSALYARGTGANPDGTTGGAFSGLGPNIYNWGVGFTVQFAVGDLPSIRAQRRIESARFATESARLRLVKQSLSAETAKARARLEGARAMVPVAGTQLSEAGSVYEQAQARYRSGLANLIEVVDAQRTYQQAEIDDALARLAVWRAELGVAIAEGDLTPFLALLGGK